MTASITGLLNEIEAPGGFAARLHAPVDDLEIEVTGVGALKFPISAHLAQNCAAWLGLRHLACASNF